ncbi:MAG: Hpt domain-containing protein, partial [Myxococcota bacterium]
TLTMGFFVVREASRAKHDALLQRGAEFAAIVADRSREAIYLGDHEQLRSSLAGLAAAPVVAYARILGPDRELLASRTMRDGIVLPEPQRPDPKAAVGPRYAQFFDRGRGLRYVDVLVPVRAQSNHGNSELIDGLPPGTQLPRILGFVQVGLGTQRLDQEIAVLEQAAMVIGGLLAAALGILASIVSERFTRSIRPLATPTPDIPEENPERELDVAELSAAPGVVRNPARQNPHPSVPRMPGTGVDPTTLRRLTSGRRGDSSEFLARVVNTYLASSEKLMASIRDGVAAGDRKVFSAAAHTLKSSSAQVGAHGLSSLCKELEALGRGGSCEGAGELANRVSEELASVQEALAAESFGAGVD